MLTTSIVNVCVVFNPSVFCIYDEREWCTAYGTLNWLFVYLNSVIKCAKQCWCTLILLPKSTLNANLTTTNRFFTNDDWQRGRFENFESDHQYESNLESDVRFKIESNHEASQVPTKACKFRLSLVSAAAQSDLLAQPKVRTEPRLRRHLIWTYRLSPLGLTGVLRRQPHRRSGLATLPSVGAVP